MTTTRSILALRPPLRRRGSIYAMVLGMSMLITVIGIGALATSRVTTRASAGATDWVKAGDLALSAVEHAIAKLNSDGATSPLTWRDSYTSGVNAYNQPVGEGRMKWFLVDEDDGVMNDDYGDAIKVYGVGEVGSTRRVYSVQLNASGEGIDALKTAFHSAGSVSLSGSVVVLNGPISTNGNLTGLASLRGLGTAEAAGTGGTVVSPVKPMPPVTVFDTYKAKATTIPTSAVSSGDLDPGTLSAANNPYGAENADGIYYVQLADSLSKLRVRPGRYKCTLLIENAVGRTAQDLEVKDEMVWEPHKDEFPILITRGMKDVILAGSTAAYYEGLTANLSEVRGLIHLIGTTTVEMKDNFYLKGCVISDGTLTTSTNIGIVATPSLFTKPPLGYSKGNRMLPVPGMWKWDTTPATWVSGN